MLPWTILVNRLKRKVIFMAFFVHQNDYNQQKDIHCWTPSSMTPQLLVLPRLYLSELCDCHDTSY